MRSTTDFLAYYAIRQFKADPEITESLERVRPERQGTTALGRETRHSAEPKSVGASLTVRIRRKPTI